MKTPHLWLLRFSYAPFTALVLVLGEQMPGQSGVIPNESCRPPSSVVFRESCGDGKPVCRDAGSGPTNVTTYGSAQRYIPMPTVEDGMMGLARLYHGTLVVDASYTAIDGTGSSLTGGDLPLVDMDSAHLIGSGSEVGLAVQPRPGTMPGLYVLQENDNFFQYGGPIESGANPQTTAVYIDPGDSVPAPVLTNNLSGAQLWRYMSASPQYIEIKHVDGSVARFDSFQPYNGGYIPSTRTLWHVTQVRDPYDNIATYEYDGLYRLIHINFPSGLTQTFDYGPSWGTWGSGYDRLEISYAQGSTALSARTWGVVFSGVTGTSGGHHFGSRLYRTYSAQRVVLEDPTSGQPHSIGSGSTVTGQVVYELTYDLTNRILKEFQSIHTGTTFAQTLTSPSGLSTLQTLEIHYVESGTGDAGRVLSQEDSLTGDLMTCSYPSSGFRTTDLLSGTVMAGIEITDASGTIRRYEYDGPTGRIYSIITTPSDDFAGHPRATHWLTENSEIGGGAETQVEPAAITIYNIFDTMCVCQKPIEVREIADRGGSLSERVTNFEYYSDSKLLKKKSSPNPETGGGSLPAQVDWEYTYIRAMTTGQEWGAWLPDTETTPDGSYTYTYSDWLNRQDATNHGRIAGSVQRTISVRIQNSLSGDVDENATNVTDTIYRNLSNSPGGLSKMGSISGQPRRLVDGDGVSTTCEYSSEGWLAAKDLQSGATRTTYTHNAYGEVTNVYENANSTAHQASTTLTLMSGVGVPNESSSSIGGLLRDTEYYFDRFGQIAVRRQNNLDSEGNKPRQHGGSGANARDWVETQYIYQHHRLVETYQDRKPLDEAAGTGQFLKTELVYDSNGRLDYVINPNGSLTYYRLRRLRDALSVPDEGSDRHFDGGWPEALRE